MSDIVALKDLCEIDITDGTHKTPTYSNEGFIFLSSKNVTSGKIDWEDIMYIPQWLHDELYKRIAPKKDDILLAKNGTTGVAAIVDKDEIFDIYVSLALIRPDKRKILPRYLLHAINSEPSKKFFDSHLKGIGVPNLHLTHIRETPINVPSFAQQQYIIDILDKLESNISLRKQQLSKLDELVKSRFIELFGECKNSVRLGDCCEVHARIGWQALTRDEHMKTGDYMLITGTDFKNGEINYSTCVYVAKERYEMDKHIILRDNDVLITKDGTIGKVAIVHNLPKPATLNAGVFVVRPDERFNKEYIANVFKGPLFSDYVEASKTGATIKHLNQKHLVEFMIPVPSLDEQEAFAQFTQQTDKSKFEIQKSLEKLETLKKALMQKYFG